jgi:hypothetical protein
MKQHKLESQQQQVSGCRETFGDILSEHGVRMHGSINIELKIPTAVEKVLL